MKVELTSLSDEILSEFLWKKTREDLRGLARLIGVDRGRNKQDTITEIVGAKNRLNIFVTCSIGVKIQGQQTSVPGKGTSPSQFQETLQAIDWKMECEEDLDVVAKEVIARQEDEEDGPWAEGWEDRTSEVDSGKIDSKISHVCGKLQTATGSASRSK